MLTSIIAIAIVVIGICAYLWVFNRLRKRNMADLLDEAINSTAAEDSPADAPAVETDKTTEIFKGVDDVSNTQSIVVGYDTDSSVTTTVSFEEKIGKDTIVVEIPDKKAKRTSSREKAIAATEAVVRKAPEKKPDTAEELIAKLKKKVARRIDLLKLAGLPESTDKALAKCRADLKKLTESVKKENPGGVLAKEFALRHGLKLNDASYLENKEMLAREKAETKAAPAKTDVKAEPARKPAKKSVKKPAKKTKKADKKPAKKTKKTKK